MASHQPISRRGMLAALGAGSSLFKPSSWVYANQADEAHSPPSVALQPSPTTWPSYQVTPTNSGVHSSATAATAPLEEWWTASIDGTVDAPPAIADGTLYFGSGEGTVYALDSETGTEHWRFHAGAAVETTPTVTPESVYIVSHAGHLTAINPDDGWGQWRVEFEDGVFGAPTVANGTVYARSHTGRVIAVDARTGEREWTATPADPGGVSTLGRQLMRTPAVTANTVYATFVSYEREPSRVVALSPNDGSLKWEYTGDDDVMSPVVRDGLVYVATGGGRVIRFDAATGTIHDQFTASIDAFVEGPACVTTDMLYVTGRGGGVVAFDRETGSERWRDSFPSSVIAPPVVVEETLYVPSINHGLVGFHATRGERQWSVSESSYVGVVVLDGRLYMVNDDSILALGPPKAKLDDLKFTGESVTIQPSGQNALSFSLTNPLSVRSVVPRFSLNIYWAPDVSFVGGVDTAPGTWSTLESRTEWTADKPIPPGESRTAQVVVQTADDAHGLYRLTARLEPGENTAHGLVRVPPVPETATITIRGKAGAPQKIPGYRIVENPICTGDTGAIDVMVRNGGQQKSDDLTLEFTLPDMLAQPGRETDDDTVWDGATTQRSLGSLAPGEFIWNRTTFSVPESLTSKQEGTVTVVVSGPTGNVAETAPRVVVVPGDDCGPRE